jgi:hypothetical protein
MKPVAYPFAFSAKGWKAGRSPYESEITMLGEGSHKS